MAESKIVKQESGLPDRNNIRSGIQNLEQEILSSNEAFVGDSKVCPLRHYFTDGIYTREIFIPAGTVLTGKIHKHEHPNFLMQGVVEVVTESGGRERLVGPSAMISPAGTKRALHAVTDLIWITVHSNPTNTQDLEKLEELIIATDYAEFEKFQNKQLPWYRKLLNLIK
jgi:hypothetical protein